MLKVFGGQSEQQNPSDDASPTAKTAGSVMINTGPIPWSPFPLEGTFFKLLHLDDDQGKASFLLKVPAGEAAAVHKHLAAVEAFVVQGGFSYPGEGSVAVGDYVYEPGGMVHEPRAEGEEDLILFVVAQGPVQGVNEDGTPGGLIDNDLMYQFAVNGGAAGHVKRG
ncbi:MAG: 2,4'-dihydroxyacetophenone dioxygenase family protein [Caulobacterales bacterium]|nr:2,4'-dihydroxyacetophenone dioxygenase family protein [Caulobacterales bacterium]